MKFLFVICASLAISIGVAQSSQEVQYGAYLKASKSLWQRGVSLATKENGEDSFARALALYGLLNNTMVSQDEDTFDEHVDDATDALKRIIKSDASHGEAMAVLSSIYGLQMAYSPMKGLFLGMKSSSLMEEAMKQSPESALVQKLYAGSKLYTPEQWGGDPDVALASFGQAIERFEAEGDTTNWLYLDAYMGLSMAYVKTDQTAKAQETLATLLAREPNHYWAKSELAKLQAE